MRKKSHLRIGLQVKLVEITDEFELLTICAQLCTYRKVDTHTHMYVYMCIASICMTDICTITDMLIIPYLTRLREFFYRR